MNRNFSATTHPKYRADIDGLRAIAVLSVVGFHAFPGWIRGGFIGVDIFFVISGFLISTIIIENTENNTFSFFDFYSRRVKRIFPALIIVLVACLTFGWYVLLPDEYKQLGKHVAAGVGFVSNLVLWNESGYFDNSGETKPLLHLWSLGVEEQFYLLCPLIIWFAWAKRLSFLRMILLVLLISFCLNIYGIYRHPIATFYSPQTRFWELACGSLLAWYSISQSAKVENISKNSRNLLSIAGHMFLAASLLLTTPRSLFPGWWAILPVSGTSLIILAGSSAWMNRVLLSRRWMVWIGLISFPLYLWHWPLLSFAHILEDQSPDRLTRALAVLLAILLAWMTYKLIESPIRRRGGQASKIIGLSVSIAIIGLFGLAGYASDGFSFRAGKSAQSTLYEEFRKNDWSINWSSTGCSQQYLQISADCITNSQSPPEVLLIGDSHSQGLYLALSKANSNIAGATSNVMRLGTYLPFFNTSVTLKPGITFSGDETNNELDFAINSPSVKVVILSFRGIINLTSKDFRNGREIEVPDRHLQIQGESGKFDSRSAFEKGMRVTLEKLSASDKEIIFVVDNPELGFHPKECVDMRRFHLTAWAPRNPCAVSRETADIRNREYRNLVFSILRSFPSVKVFDTVDALCDSSWCEARREGRFLYQDDNHLSVFGSEYIARRLMTSIETKFKWPAR